MFRICKMLQWLKAAIAAGYSEKTARVKASQLLTKVNIQEELTRLKQNIAETIGINAVMLAGYSEKTANRIGPENLSKLVISELLKIVFTIAEC